jgi:hypothetical protein
MGVIPETKDPVYGVILQLQDRIADDNLRQKALGLVTLVVPIKFEVLSASEQPINEQYIQTFAQEMEERYGRVPDDVAVIARFQQYLSAREVDEQYMRTVTATIADKLNSLTKDTFDSLVQRYQDYIREYDLTLPRPEGRSRDDLFKRAIAVIQDIRLKNGPALNDIPSEIGYDIESGMPRMYGNMGMDLAQITERRLGRALVFEYYFLARLLKQYT